MNQSRRTFMKNTGCALSAAALVSTLDQLNVVHAAIDNLPEAASDYKALVCIFLFGGNDCNNTIIPLDSEYNSYSSVRNASGLAIPQSSLISLPNSTGGGGRPFGMHPNLSPEVATPSTAKGLLDIWNAQKLAVLFNMGNLIQPLTKAQYQANIGKPYQLFSHSDQQTQQQTVVSNGASQTGWGGRTADNTGLLNGAVPLPMAVSVAGTSLFTTGQTTRPLAIAPAPTPVSQVLVLNASGGTGADQSARKSTHSQLLQMDLGLSLVKTSSETTSAALVASAALSTDPSVGTFPNSSLGNQLKQVAKLVKLKDVLGMKRQIFFCSMGGYDTHTNQTSSTFGGNQGNNFTQLSQAMRAFYDEMVAQGTNDMVTTFTQSDFGRTLQPSGTGAAAVGSDHAWGNHAFIMGGGVLGRAFYGAYPILSLGGPDDTDSRGRWIPTTSTDQYAATLASWFGLAPADIAKVFPNLYRFASSNLGFLG
jgi:uncharacterized protein (DUF1501 family)